LKLLLLPFLIFLLTACNEPPTYHLLYPIEASKQKVSRLDGYRFLSSTLPSPASIIVLSNPVENGGFLDFAFALTNNSDKNIHLSSKDFIFKLSKIGNLTLLAPIEYKNSPAYKEPDGYDTLTPKMQAYGCVGSNTKDNVSPSAFNASESWVWQRHLQYPFKRGELYLQDLEIQPKETKGVIWRLKIPHLADDFEEGTVYIKFDLNGEAYRFKFILQSLS